MDTPEKFSIAYSSPKLTPTEAAISTSTRLEMASLSTNTPSLSKITHLYFMLRRIPFYQLLGRFGPAN
jgi:hypothetical protein